MIYARNKRTKEHEIADMTAPYGFDWEFLQTDKQGWIPHKGESCPLPNDAKCSVLLVCESNGAKEYKEDILVAGNLRWTHNGTQWDIVAYRPFLKNDRKKLLEKLVEVMTEWPSTHFFMKWDCGSFSATDNPRDDGIVFTRDEWLAARGDWDGKTWPPKEGERVKVRLAMESDYRPGTVVGVGDIVGGVRIAVKTDCGKLPIYTSIGDGMVKPLRSVEDEAVDAMLADVDRANRCGFDVCDDESFARALYRMGWRK